MNLTEVHFEEILLLARKLGQESAEVDDLTTSLRLRVDELVRTGWIGRGANAFYDDMYQALLPALGRLRDSLTDGAIFLQKTAVLFDDAQQQAAAEFSKISPLE